MARLAARSAPSTTMEEKARSLEADEAASRRDFLLADIFINLSGVLLKNLWIARTTQSCWRMGSKPHRTGSRNGVSLAETDVKPKKILWPKSPLHKTAKSKRLLPRPWLILISSQ